VKQENKKKNMTCVKSKSNKILLYEKEKTEQGYNKKNIFKIGVE
jgi:hypothetical protein